MPFSPALDCWFLSGATASGKTGLGVALAQRIDAEIISLDSMALYRGMDLGTAKPTAAERGAVPHHLVDVLEPEQEFSLAQYLDAAHRAIGEIKGRGREVLFVGGTPLYLKSLLRGIFQGPPADWDLRRRLCEQARTGGPDFLHRRLAKVDPAAAERLHPNDTRRLIRALEVYEKTGQPISRLQGQFEVGHPAAECRVFVLQWPTAELNARIERRVDAMFAAGLVEEVRTLLNRPRPAAESARIRASFAGESANPEVWRLQLPLSRTAAQAAGYREVIEHLRGRRTLAETVQLVKTHTRQLAKRQRTWFRSLSECRFVPVHEPLNPAEVARQIAEEGSCGMMNTE